MSHRLKKKNSPVSLAFTKTAVEEIVNDCQDVEDNLLHKTLECQTNGKDQLQNLKRFFDEVKINDTYIAILTKMFINCTSKHPFRRSLVSYFQSLEDEMTFVLIEKMSLLVTSYLTNKNKEAGSLRDGVELVNALLENFPIGNEIVDRNTAIILDFVKESLTAFINKSKEDVGPVLQTKMLNHMHTTLKTILLVLCRCKQNNNLQQHYDRYQKLAATSIDILTNESVVLECRSSAALVFSSTTQLFQRDSRTELLKALQMHLQSQPASVKLLECFAPNIGTLFAQLHRADVQLVLINSYLAQLNFTEENNYADLLALFAQRIIDITLSRLEKPLMIQAFKSLAVWIDLVKQICDVEKETQLLIDELLNCVLPHLVSYVDHHIDTVRHSIVAGLKTAFCMLAANHREYILRFMHNYISDLDSRGKICILITLTDFITVDEILKLKPNLPTYLLNIISDRNLYTHACNLYKALAQKHLAECSDKQQWYSMWTEKLDAYLTSEDKDVKTVVADYIVPNLLVVNPHLLKHFVEELDSNKSWVKVRSALAFIKAARAMKNINKDVFGEVFDKQSDEKWRNSLPIQDMQRCLTHIDKQIRLDVLSLLCISSKTTDSISALEIDMIKHFLKFNTAVDDPSFRQQAIHEFKKLFLRMFDHIFKLNKDKHNETDVYVKRYANFLRWFLAFLFDHLYLSGPYCQTSFSLNLLLLLTNIFEAHKTSLVLTHMQFSTEEKQHFTQIITKCFEDTYDPNRVIVYTIVAKHPHFLCEPIEKNELFAQCLERLQSPQPDVTSIAAYYLSYLALYDAKDFLGENKPPFFEGSGKTAFLLAGTLLTLLEEQVAAMEEGLIKGSQSSPMYGVLYSIRLLFQHQKWSANGMDESEQKQFAGFIDRLITVCLKIIELVAPYVTTEAPEGHLCGVSLVEVFKQLDVSDKESVGLQAHIARMLLVCSWRSMKEVSLLQGIIVSNFASSGVVLTKSTLLKIWDMFCDVLLRSKHAGACEFASAGFMELCTVLWLHKDPELSGIPRQAVLSTIAELRDASNSDFCITRRSAGIPFYLQAICNTEPSIKAQAMFNHLMKALIVSCDDTSDITRFVVTVNVLRHFYKDAKLGEDVFPYVTQGVVIAIQGFSSEKWAIRNSCTLLYSSLMGRIFGVKKSKMTGREFFSRYPDLYPFLLAKAEETKGCGLNADVFPLLLLLSHLYPSALEGSQPLMKLDAFIPFVMRCGRSPVYKARKMAANALLPLVPLDHIVTMVTKILSDVTEETNDENFIHGSLLQVQSLLSRDLVDSTIEQRLVEMRWLLKSHRSMVYQNTYIDILNNVLKDTIHSSIEESLCDVLKRSIATDFKSTQAGQCLFMKSAFKMIVRFSKSSLLEEFAAQMLRSEALEAQRLAIEYFQSSGVISDNILSDIVKIRSAIFPEILLLVVENEKRLSYDQLLTLWQYSRTHSSESEEVQCCVIKLASVLLQKSAGEVEKEIWQFLHVQSSDESDADCRTTVAKNIDEMHVKRFSNDDQSYYLFMDICINLLRDNEPFIRDIAANQLYSHKASPNETYVPQPQVVLSQLIQDQLFLRMREDKTNCLHYVIRNILPSPENESESVVHPCVKQFVVFEEGKCNPYFDDVNLSRAMTAVVARCFEEKLDLDFVAFKELLEKYKPTQNSMFFKFYEQLNRLQFR